VTALEYSEWSDIWGIGTIAFSLLFGYPPFSSDSNVELFEKIVHAKVDYPPIESISTNALDFVSKILIVNPKERMTTDAML